MKRFLILPAILLALSAAVLPAAVRAADDRPNVVWILSEDNSVHYLAHFFPGGARAPNIEALADAGLTFTHAFCNAPVCSVARTALATGCHGPRIGTQFHRKYKPAPMPEGLRMFPAYLRDAGYYTTNNAKKDYNAIEGNGVWDESSNRASWRNRPDRSQPFFHMESHAQSHESSLHFKLRAYENEKTQTDPTSVQLAGCFPDTPLFRYTHARYLDRMAVIDEIVGRTVARLQEDGLLEDTFIFYFGDNGGVLPRSKGYLYESGLHVPLVVRVPENYRHLVGAEVGSRVDGFVNFIDFGPTVLRLAGVDVPKQVDGKPFLGKGVSMKEVNARDESFGYADRFDEKYDLVRSLRKGKYQYIRSYQSYLPDALQNNYRYKMLAYQQWRELFSAGKLSGPPLQFFRPKPVEALFDVEADPHEINNLARDPAYGDVLAGLRARLQQIVEGLPDLSFYPESYLVENALENPVAFGRSHRAEIAALVETADLALLPYETARPRIQEALKSENPMVRCWGATVCSCFGKQAADLADRVEALLGDDAEIVRVRALESLGILGRRNPQPALAEIVNATGNPVLATEALNSVVFFRDLFRGRYGADRADFHPVCQGADIDDRLNYINGVPYPPRPPRAR
ncbi:MAG: sulfatase-like hydrolase/transferase [Pirellulales bacterium]|nr:sulfatase-like hydrolase/transferase [Pirellulales bacterium]